jgi:putative FmdB family regulatory protein
VPKYDYRCTACGHVYEKQEGFDAPAQQSCPQCSGLARRILVPPAIIFKGSGWYATDSRKSVREGVASSAKAETKSEAKEESTHAPASSDSGTASTGTAEKAS